MTRINCVDPALLIDEHLGAEYRELPRVFGLVRSAIARSETPETCGAPERCVLGAGHVRFFYPRLAYLCRRYAELVAECVRRGRVVNYPDPVLAGIDDRWFGDWSPDAAAVELNMQRLKERGGIRPLVDPKFPNRQT